MKRRTVALILLCAALLGLLTGCIGGGGQMPFTTGSWTGDHFDSAFMDLRFTLPEGWVAEDEDTLDEMSAAADQLLDLQKGGAGENPQSVYHYELSAKDPETGAGVLILVQSYTTDATNYIKGLQDGAKAEGAAYTTGDSLTLELAGHFYLVLSLTMEGQDTPYQRQYVRKDGDYLINIMMFTPDAGADAFDELEALFVQLSKL